MRAQAARAPTRGGKRKGSRARAIPAHSVARRYIQGYVGAFLRDGFGASGLVLQIAHEIAAALPEIFRGLRVTQAWAYKYDEAHARGIDAHADQAVVSALRARARALAERARAPPRAARTTGTRAESAPPFPRYSAFTTLRLPPPSTSAALRLRNSLYPRSPPPPLPASATLRLRRSPPPRPR